MAARPGDPDGGQWVTNRPAVRGHTRAQDTGHTRTQDTGHTRTQDTLGLRTQDTGIDANLEQQI